MSDIRTFPRRAGYTAHNSFTMFSLACRLSPSRSQRLTIGAIATCLGLHGGRGHRPHAIVDRPGTLSSSTSPRLGIGGQHQRLHRCALDGFLGPPSEKVVLTRILRHPLVICKSHPLMLIIWNLRLLHLIVSRGLLCRNGTPARQGLPAWRANLPKDEEHVLGVHHPFGADNSGGG